MANTDISKHMAVVVIVVAICKTILVAILFVGAVFLLLNGYSWQAMGAFLFSFAAAASPVRGLSDKESSRD